MRYRRSDTQGMQGGTANNYNANRAYPYLHMFPHASHPHLSPESALESRCSSPCMCPATFRLCGAANCRTTCILRTSVSGGRARRDALHLGSINSRMHDMCHTLGFAPFAPLWRAQWLWASACSLASQRFPEHSIFSQLPTRQRRFHASRVHPLMCRSVPGDAAHPAHGRGLRDRVHLLLRHSADG